MCLVKLSPPSDTHSATLKLTTWRLLHARARPLSHLTARRHLLERLTLTHSSTHTPIHTAQLAEETRYKPGVSAPTQHSESWGGGGVCTVCRRRREKHRTCSPQGPNEKEGERKWRGALYGPRARARGSRRLPVPRMRTSYLTFGPFLSDLLINVITETAGGLKGTADVHCPMV